MGPGGRGRGGDDRPPKEVWGKPEDNLPAAPVVEVKPVLELSGKLAAETNKVGSREQCSEVLQHCCVGPCWVRHAQPATSCPILLVRLGAWS